MYSPSRQKPKDSLQATDNNNKGTLPKRTPRNVLASCRRVCRVRAVDSCSLGETAFLWF